MSPALLRLNPMRQDIAMRIRRGKCVDLRRRVCCKITTDIDKDALIPSKEIVNEENSNKVTARSMVTEFL